MVPKSIAVSEPLDLQDSCTEVEALAELRQIADQNKLYKNFIGQGYYGTHTPAVIQRNILENRRGIPHIHPISQRFHKVA